jgi:hypothetical protein
MRLATWREDAVGDASCITHPRTSLDLVLLQTHILDPDRRAFPLHASGNHLVLFSLAYARAREGERKVV